MIVTMPVMSNHLTKSSFTMFASPFVFVFSSSCIKRWRRVLMPSKALKKGSPTLTQPSSLIPEQIPTTPGKVLIETRPKISNSNSSARCFFICYFSTLDYESPCWLNRQKESLTIRHHERNNWWPSRTAKSGHFWVVPKSQHFKNNVLHTMCINIYYYY